MESMILKVNTPMILPGEKEAKRQRSEPTTPVSTSSRLPYEYDALMGITRVGTKETAADRRNPRPQSRVEQGRFYW